MGRRKKVSAPIVGKGVKDRFWSSAEKDREYLAQLMEGFLGSEAWDFLKLSFQLRMRLLLLNGTKDASGDAVVAQLQVYQQLLDHPKEVVNQFYADRQAFQRLTKSTELDTAEEPYPVSRGGAL